MALADVRVDISQVAVDALASDWDGPVGRAILDAVGIVEDTARITAPVSRKGSRRAPPGYLKSHTRQSVTLHHDDNGHVLGLVGAIRYPFDFIRNPTSNKGFTWNRGHEITGSFRPGNNRYLDDSLNSLGGFVRYEG